VLSVYVHLECRSSGVVVPIGSGVKVGSLLLSSVESRHDVFAIVDQTSGHFTPRAAMSP
jgi:hypothetical protein